MIKLSLTHTHTAAPPDEGRKIRLFPLTATRYIILYPICALLAFFFSFNINSIFYTPPPTQAPRMEEIFLFRRKHEKPLCFPSTYAGVCVYFFKKGKFNLFIFLSAPRILDIFAMYYDLKKKVGARLEFVCTKFM